MEPAGDEAAAEMPRALAEPTVASVMAAFSALAEPSRGDVAELVLALEEVQRLAVERHSKSIEASRAALALCRETLDGSGVRRPTGSRVQAARPADPVEAPRLSDSQWLVCFMLEFSAAVPDAAREGVFRIASAARLVARHIEPEHAAASAAVGIMAALLH